MIGYGSYAVVLRAADRELGIDVAVKVLAEQHCDDPVLRERFVEEARMMRRLRSASIIAVTDIGATAEGQPWFVMSLAEGGTLLDRLLLLESRGWVPTVENVAGLIDALAGPLDVLERAGIVHRDIKADNVLLVRRPQRTQGRHSPLVPAGLRAVSADLGMAAAATAHETGGDGVTRETAGGAAASARAGARAPELLGDGPMTNRTDLYAATQLVERVARGATTRQLPGPLSRWCERGRDPATARRHGDAEGWRASGIEACLAPAHGEGDKVEGG